MKLPCHFNHYLCFLTHIVTNPANGSMSPLTLADSRAAILVFVYELKLVFTAVLILVITNVKRKNSK